jgi:hypothetical protein
MNIYPWIQKIFIEHTSSARVWLIFSFQLCVFMFGALSLFELFWQGDRALSAYALTCAYGASLVFGIVYTCYIAIVPGELSRDSLNAKTPPTGRETFRRLGLFCAALLLVRGLFSLSSFAPAQIALPLLGAFATVFGIGLISRWFCERVTLDQDLGIKPAKRP